MTDGMEIMVLSILGPAVHCHWMVPTWQEAFLTSVSKHRVAGTRDVRIPKYCVRISPRIPTTDPRPRPRPQADAVSDPLPVRESATRFLTHVYIRLTG